MIGFDALKSEFEALDGATLLGPLIREVFPGRIALVSSFGAESAVLLHMVSEIDPKTPVIFLNTGKLFRETLDYQRELTKRLALQDVRVVEPLPADVQFLDKDGELWRRSVDACCQFRKVEPLERALAGFQAWITGRKRFQGGIRKTLDPLEHADWRFKVNPLVGWSEDRIDEYMQTHDLPRHPLVAEGYPSIGCKPCTIPANGTDARSGRWAEQEKTECGIHWSANGTPVRGPSPHSA
jgi:phosphoadenosine phosphosulfate reductase